MIYLSGLTLEELKDLCAKEGHEPYRASQMMDSIYRRQILKVNQMMSLPQTLRASLPKLLKVHDLEVAEKAQSFSDKSIKYLFRLGDGELVEAVWMPQRHFRTICVSSQVGCPLKCTFCASGQVRYRRNLLPHEMVSQILLIQADLKAEDRLEHIVFMGMGEPLLNIENLQKAITIINAPWGIGLGARRITVSTAGYVPGIQKWADSDSILNQVRLSISLHATRDDVRNRIMPINHKYSLSDLMNAVRIYCGKTGRRVTLEYLLLKDVNDRKEDAQELAELAKGVAHSVNVIEYNEVEGTSLQMSTRSETIMSELKRQGIVATLRQSKGRDIAAGCGQLRNTFIKKS